MKRKQSRVIWRTLWCVPRSRWKLKSLCIFMEYQSSRRNCALIKRYCEVFTVPSKRDKLTGLNYIYMHL